MLLETTFTVAVVAVAAKLYQPSCNIVPETQVVAVGSLMVVSLTKPVIAAPLTIKEGGFEPQLRNQQYEWRKLPEMIEEQVIDY